MIAEGNTLKMIRGDSESFTLHLETAEQVVVPFVTGDIVYFSVKEKFDDEDYVLQKIITSFNAEGKAEVNIDYDDTKELDFGQYYYDAQVTFISDGSRKTFIKPARFMLLWEVTTD